MFLKYLQVQNFRNHLSFEQQFDKKFVHFIGPNSKGKTSLLEAIYFVSIGKSFRTKQLPNLINHLQPQSSSNGCFVKILTNSQHDNTESLNIFYNGKKKSIQLNEKKPQSNEEFFKKLPVITICPNEIDLINGDHSIRRTFMDRMAFYSGFENYQLLKKAQVLIQQKKILIHKVRYKTGLLKNILEEMCLINEILWDLTCSITELRQNFVDQITHSIITQYNTMCLTESQLKIKYESNMSLIQKNMGTFDALKISEIELHRGRCLLSIDLDKYQFDVGKSKASDFLSQGDLKSLLIAVKLAVFNFIYQKIGIAPLILIDDLTTELDIGRTQMLFKTVNSLPCQVFITSTQALKDGFVAIENYQKVTVD